MSIISRPVTEWQNMPIEKKIIASWVISLLVVVSLSAILYSSKKELHLSSNVIVQNTHLRVATQGLLRSIQVLEISSKKYMLTGNKSDSERYFSNLDSLQKNLLRLENLIKDQPRFLKFFFPLQRTIRNELYKINHLAFHVKNEKVINSKVIGIEEGIYQKLDNYWQLLDNEEEQATSEQIQVLNSKINENLNYFFIMIITYILLLSTLFIVISADVKKRRKLAAEVAESRKELGTIINTAPALIFVKDKEKKFTLLNKSFLNFFNVDYAKILNHSNEQLVMRNEQWLTNEEDETIIKNKISLINIERETTTRDGNTLWLNINKAPILDENDNVVGIVGVMDDITKRIEFQNELIDAHKKLEELNKQKDKFFSIIAHDLRSPFTGMLGLAEILIEDDKILTEEEKNYSMQNFRSSLKNLLSLIDNLLTWARLNLNRVEYSPKEILLSDVINSVFSSQSISAASKKIELQFHGNENKKLFADPDMIETIIRNLVSNAIKFTNTNGKIIVNIIENDTYTKVEIKDNGVGMKSEIADNLFKLDGKVTTRGTNDEKGTGLGLIVCKEFVEKHGGTISVESKVGVGTTISFTLLKKNNS